MYTQIRVKSIQFIDEQAIAIYFYDITHQVEALKPQEVSRSDYYYHASVANEFHNPLNVMLMYLQTLCGK